MKLAAPSTFQRLCSPMGLDVATLDSGALLPTVTLWILGFSGPTQTQMPPNRKLHVWQPMFPSFSLLIITDGLMVGFNDWLAH